MQTIFAMNAAHISKRQIVLATIMNKWLAIPASLLWSRLHAGPPGGGGSPPEGKSRGVSPMRCFGAAMGITFAAGAVCLFMHHSWQYWLLQVLLAFAGSGTFAFGRSILADLTPPEVRGVRGVA